LFPGVMIRAGMFRRGLQVAAGLLSAAVLVPVLAAQEPTPSPSPEVSPSPRPETDAGTRAYEWRTLRQQRFTRIQPDKPGFLERQVLTFEKAERPSLLELNLRGLYPRIQGIARGSRPAAGVRFWQPDIGPSGVDIHGSAFWSIAGYELYDLQFGRIPHRDGKLPRRSTEGLEVDELGDLTPQGPARQFRLHTSLRYQHFPRVHYFGPGPDSRLADESTFLDQKAFYELVGGYQFSARFSLTGRAGYLQAFVGPGEDASDPGTQDLFTDAGAPGLLRQPDFLVFSGQAFWDGRDQPGNPRRGVAVGVQVSRADDRGGEHFGFTRMAADVRGFVTLGSIQRVLALRAHISSDNPDPGARVPFYLQENLGGSHTLRGFESFRFRDDTLLLLQAEYRWYPGPAVELALFADAGRVAPRVRDLFERLEADLGVGLRFKSNRATYFRVDLARSREGSRLLLRFNQGF